jgi:hypothetical protein
MQMPSSEVISFHIRRAALVLLAGFVALIALGFLTAAAWLALAETYGVVLACTLLGGVYVLLAVLVLLLRPRQAAAVPPDRLTVGIALGSSFAQGFLAGRDVRR